MKEDLRRELLKERDSIENKKEKSHIIFTNLQKLPLWKEAKIINTYVSFKSEVDTRFLIYHALIEGKKVLCPKVQGKDLLFGEITSFNDLVKGAYGILEPISLTFLDPEEIDVILVPGIAFDLQGFRLGYGKGFYDRFLKNLKNPIKIGLTFDKLIKEKLPTTENDIKMDLIISEERVIIIKKAIESLCMRDTAK